MYRSVTWSIRTLGISSFLFASAAYADASSNTTPGPATVDAELHLLAENVNTGEANFDQAWSSPGTYRESVSGFDGAAGGAVTIKLGADPFLSIESAAGVTGAVGSGAAGGALADIKYSFVIHGPVAADVPVYVRASGELHGAGSILFDWGAGYAALSSYDGIASDGLTSFSVDGAYYYQPNQPQEIEMFMIADPEANTGPAGFFQSTEGYIDPTFTLGAASREAGYTLEFSPGIDASAVPEPAVWAVMLLGVSLIGTRLRGGRVKFRPSYV